MKLSEYRAGGEEAGESVIDRELEYRDAAAGSQHLVHPSGKSRVKKTPESFVNVSFVQDGPGRGAYISAVLEHALSGIRDITVCLCRVDRA